MNPIVQTLAARMMGEHSDRLRSITENIVNTTTPGYRKTVCECEPFDSLLQSKIAPPRIMTSFGEGAARITNNPLDFSIQGEGFFVINQGGNSLLTRNGQFHLDPDGTLLNSTNLPVQGEGGDIRIPIDVPTETLTVAKDGTLMSEDRVLGKLQIVSVNNPQTLQRAGTTLFLATKQTEQTTPPNLSVQNRTLEASNGSMYEEMTELIQCTRSFEMCQKIIRSRDGAEGEMVRSMG